MAASYCVRWSRVRDASATPHKVVSEQVTAIWSSPTNARATRSRSGFADLGLPVAEQVPLPPTENFTDADPTARGAVIVARRSTAGVREF